MNALGKYLSCGLRLLIPLLVAAACHPTAALACAACYGQSDSAMARGFNWGILSLLGVVVGVLGGIASFFFVLARRASTAPPTPPSPQPLPTNLQS